MATRAREANDNANVDHTGRSTAGPRKPKPGPTCKDSEDTHPLVAAYESGRLLNQIDWHLQQAWLLPAIDLARALYHEWAGHAALTSLPATLCPALPVARRERSRDFCLSRGDEWARLFSSASHKRDIEDTVRFIQHELTQENECDPSLLREEQWGVVLSPVENFGSGLYHSVENQLDDHGKLALQLGRWVDRGVHPRAVYRYMCWQPRTKPQITLPTGWSLWDMPADGGRSHEPGPSHNAGPSVLFPFIVGRDPPESGWLDQLNRCWDDLGLPPPCPTSFSEAEDEADEQIEETGIIRYITKLDGMVRSELGDMPHPVMIPPEERTKPMTLRKAAGLMGFQQTKDGAERVRALISDGSVRSQKLSRQAYVFSKKDFPKFD